MPSPARSSNAAVVVCTRDRPDDLARCLKTLLSMQGPQCQLIVVDQSAGPETAALVAELGAGGGQPVEYVDRSRPGLSGARNAALPYVDREIILFTDDDCEVSV